MYRECAPDPALSELVQCMWQHQGGGAWIVPDACVDLIWNGRSLIVAGPDTKPLYEQVNAPVTGLRLRTGCAPLVLGVPATALRDGRVELHELWGDRAKHLLDAIARDGATAALQRAVRVARPDAMVMQSVERLRAQPALRLPRLASELGVSERQLNRRFSAAVGYGPKMLARVLRMQNFVRELKRDPHENLAALAARLGFVDQAHLGHEASALHGRTPGQLRVRAMSDFDKRRAG